MADYQEGAPALAPFYFGHPSDPGAYRRKAEAVERRFDAERRRRMAGAVRPTSDAAAQRLERIAAGDGFFVTTGQQAGLFTGPLYTIYKALSAVRLAAALEEELGRPVAPLFWVASEDHDWHEANHARLLDRENTLRTIELPSQPDEPPVSMGRRRLGPAIETALAELEEILPPTEFRGGLLERLHGAYRPERTVAGAFAELLADWLAPFDLLLVDAGDPVVKELSADVLARELARAEAHEALLRAQTERLEAAGYHAQVGVIAGASNVFHEDEHGRERLLREDGGWILRRSGRRLGDEALERIARTSPERLSPNVFLRPVVESAVFPTLAYVGGPAEVSYFAQIGCLFEAHGVEMPLVAPRHGAVLVESKVRKVLDKFDLEPSDFRLPVHELGARVAREELPSGVREAIGSLARSLQTGYAALVDAATQIDASLAGPLKSARNTSLREVSEAEKKIAHHLKEQNAIALEQLEKAAANLYPAGKPQERVLNATQYLARYGPGLLAEIADAMAVERSAGASPAWSGVRCG